MLLFPDPRPLVERLGREFFRRLPEKPGVYLMRDSAETVLYVGKAKNLRKRLGSYRVANPDRMARRHLRLLRAVVRIELQECADEAAALAREAELLRTLRPRFNRAGTWVGPRRFLAWRLTESGLEMAVHAEAGEGWNYHGPLGSSVFGLRAVLVRVLWCALQPELGLARMPEGWFAGRLGETVALPCGGLAPAELEALGVRLSGFFAGQAEELVAWIRERTAAQTQAFEVTVREADLEMVTEFGQRLVNRLNG